MLANYLVNSSTRFRSSAITAQNCPKYWIPVGSKLIYKIRDLGQKNPILLISVVKANLILKNLSHLNEHICWVSLNSFWAIRLSYKWFYFLTLHSKWSCEHSLISNQKFNPIWELLFILFKWLPNSLQIFRFKWVLSYIYRLQLSKCFPPGLVPYIPNWAILWDEKEFRALRERHA